MNRNNHTCPVYIGTLLAPLKIEKTKGTIRHIDCIGRSGENIRGCAGLIRQGEQHGPRHGDRKETRKIKRDHQPATTQLRPDSLA